MKKELDKLYSESAEARSGLKSELKTKSWRDFSFERANEGDEAALGVLRLKLKPITDFGEGAFIGKGPNNVMVSGLSKELFSDGRIEYQASGGLFVDRGEAIVIKKGSSEAALKAGLLLAQAKFGDDFALKGPEEFLEKAGLLVAKGSRDNGPEVGKTKGKDLIR
ncbi:MAG: hypothetical protein NTX25_23675 [Proteobacteria bacterium]|nr:hypothetical protein [Pseudomonadota bacterium]